MMGEAGEIANKVKKMHMSIMHPEWIGVDGGLATPLEIRDEIIDEIGDTLFYLVAAMGQLNINFYEVFACQAKKLSEQDEFYQRTFLK